ncbi:hypothetical protein Z949_3949 [Sulfitobacter guttiformis KCTC 32187]|nr:hypothetical protein Z949_3949 [Sulfitobacter guttiformis KCTC 32187]
MDGCHLPPAEPALEKTARENNDMGVKWGLPSAKSDQPRERTAL